MTVDAKDSRATAEQWPQINLLPQYGFGPELSFRKLVETNPFLFRVYTPRPLGPFFNDTDPYFLGESFSEAFEDDEDRSLSDINPLPRPPSVKGSAVFSASYADAVRHLDWTTRSSSSFVSTSFSFAWAVWEACKRYKVNVKHDVHIAVIDAKALVNHAVTALELLRDSKPEQRHPNHWKWYRFALESQDVMVFQSVPGTAVLSSIPLLSVLDSLPSYFLRPVTDAAHPSKLGTDTISRITWEYTPKKSSYRHFCQQMSERFLRMDLECRLRDTTTGSIRLALRLLHTRFHERVLDNLDSSVDLVYQLSLLIAGWPGQWWVRDQPGIPELIRSMVRVVGEEIREARRAKVATEVARLQSIVNDLEWLARDHDCGSTQVGSEDGTDAGILVPEKADVQIQADVRIEEEDLAPVIPTIVVVEQGTYVPVPVTDAEKHTPPPPPEKSLSPQGQFRGESVDTVSAAGPTKPATVALAPILEREDSTATLSHSSFAMTASSAVTGFLFGTFAALCILAPPRRELLHLT